MNDSANLPQAAVILPYREGKILLQLRDDKEGIVFPGMWGFFSGSIESGETPLECAHRELYEELGCVVNTMHPLSVETAEVPHRITLHSFYCHLPCSLEEITLQEGYDLNLFSFQEISARQLYSPKAGRFFPVISHAVILDIAGAFFRRLRDQSVV